MDEDACTAVQLPQPFVNERYSYREVFEQVFIVHVVESYLQMPIILDKSGSDRPIEDREDMCNSRSSQGVIAAETDVPEMPNQYQEITLQAEPC